MNNEFEAPVNWRPEAPDGQKYPFNCCSLPDVWEDLDGARCRNCGYDWTEAEPE